MLVKVETVVMVIIGRGFQSLFARRDSRVHQTELQILDNHLHI